MSTYSCTYWFKTLVVLGLLGSSLYEIKAEIRNANLLYKVDTIDLSGGTVAAELLTFDVVLVDTEAILSWTSENETQHSHYELERRYEEADEFEKVAEFRAVNLAGKHDYEWTDKAMDKDGIFYYRIKSIDANSFFGYSSVKALRFVKKFINQLQVYPNPSSGQFKISLQLEKPKRLYVEMYTKQGQLVDRKEISDSLEAGEHDLLLSFPVLAKGYYIMKIVVGKKVLVKQVLIQ